MVKTVIVEGARTPIGKLGGSLRSLTAPELGAVAMKEAMLRANVQPAEVDEVIIGTVLQGGRGSFRPDRPREKREFLGTSKRKRSIKSAHQE